MTSKLAIKPTGNELVYDTLVSAGVNVDEWQGNRDHAYLKRQWNFGGAGNDDPIVLFNWWTDIAEFQGELSYSEDAHEARREQSEVMVDKTASSAEKALARKRLSYISHRLELVQKAYSRTLPVRFVLLLGKKGELVKGTSSVTHRKLDPENWYVHDISPFGFFRLVRGRIPPPSIPFDDQVSEIFSEKYLREDLAGETPSRDRSVRLFAQKRAGGRCEVPGCVHSTFLTHRGAIYLEVHHVIPISVGGPDKYWNVAAVCAAHHRETHYGESRLNLLTELLRMLESKHPEKLDDIHGLERLTTMNNWFVRIDHSALD
jgi:hypothetical protein